VLTRAYATAFTDFAATSVFALILLLFAHKLIQHVSRDAQDEIMLPDENARGFAQVTTNPATRHGLTGPAYDARCATRRTLRDFRTLIGCDNGRGRDACAHEG
jgi:hypothetical protein